MQPHRRLACSRRDVLKTAAWAAGCVALGCRVPSGGREVVVYTALDQEFSEPIFADFMKLTGIRVRPKYDTEANKTIGLVNLIMNEQARPRCDVFWNNEILNTIRLEKAGLLEAFAPVTAEAFPAAFRSPNQMWHGFAARARVLLVNTKRLAAQTQPQSILDLVRPETQGQGGIAKPLFGTTSTHAACLFAAWGKRRAQEFFRQVARHARIYPGNRQVAQAVSAGQIAFGLTDTDDAMVEREGGFPVEIVYPDQQEGGLGTLFLPNTVSLIKGGPRPERARQLIEYLLSPAVEKKLAEGRSAQIPLNPALVGAARVATPATIRAMPVDFSAAAESWPTAASTLRDLFASA